MQSNVVSRRRVLQLFGSAIAGMSVATACKPIGSPATATSTSVSTASTLVEVRKGGTLIYAQLASIQNTLPHPSGPATNAFRWAIFNPLVSLDQHKQPVPALAKSWTYSEDRLTLTFKLRQGVMFHSARPLTADEATWSLEYAKDPKTGAQSGGELKAVQMRAVDSATIELTLPDVMPHIFSLLSDVMILDPQSDITLNAAGTGAFKLDGLTPGVEMRLVRNPQYWRTDRPHLDGVTIKMLPDPGSAVVNLESRAVSLVQVRASDIERLKAETGTSIFVAPASGSYDLLINTLDQPLSDKRVRQAIDLALDRKRFSESLLYGLAEPSYIMWPRPSPAWDASLDVGEFNLNKAKQLLADAGYSSGFETKIQASNGYPEGVQFDQIIQADLSKIGIAASIEVVEAAQASALNAQAKFPALLSLSFGYSDADPALAFTAPPFRPSGNASRFQSDEYTQLVDSARREPDSNKRLALYRRIATYIKDQAFVLPLANYNAAFGMRSNVQGFARQPLSVNPDFEGIWLT